MNTNELNGRHNMGMLYDYMELLAIPEQLRATYQAVGRRSIGYCRSNTNTSAEYGGNRNASTWAKSLSKSKATFLRNIAALEELGLITVHKGSQYRMDGGSYPNYYSINFDTALQTKHNIYFNLAGVSSKQSKFDTESEYVSLSDGLQPKYSADGVSTPTWIDELARRRSSLTITQRRKQFGTISYPTTKDN